MATAYQRFRHVKKTFAFLFSTFLAGTLAAGNGKLAKDLEALNGASNIDVIVQFKEAPAERQHQKIRARGGSFNKSLGLIKGALYSVPAGKLKDLADDPEVVFVSPDRPLRGAVDNAVPAVFGDIAQKYGWDGTGIGVAVLDSGIDDLP